MARSLAQTQPASAPAEALEVELARIGASVRISYARGLDIQHSRGCGEDGAG